MNCREDASTNSTHSAFTLLEMIGVLAIVAVLSSVLIPQVLDAISRSKLLSVQETANSAKVALHEYYLQQRALPSTSEIVSDMIAKNILDAPPSVPAYVGASATIVSKSSGSGAGKDARDGSDYDLSGNDSPETEETIYSLQINNIDVGRAEELDEIIDKGVDTSADDVHPYDSGKLVWEDQSPKPTAYIYLEHR